MRQENKAQLIGYYGSDNSHALAAWSSTFLELNIPIPEEINTRVDALVEYILSKNKKIRSVKQLLNYLAEHSHTSPFRFSTLHFVTTTDIATHIHFLKHSVALSAENAESARYKEIIEDNYYIPNDWKDTGLSDESRELWDESDFIHHLNWVKDKNWGDILDSYTKLGNMLYHLSLKDISQSLGKQRAKETARFFKTYNSQLNSNKLMSFDGFLQIYNKRNLKTASQREIGYVVEEMLEQIKLIEGNPFKHTLEAFKL